MKRWLAVFVASAALLASTATPPKDDPVIEEEDSGTTQKRTDAGLEFEIYSATNVGDLEGVWVQAGDGANPFMEARAPDAGDPWVDALTPRTVSTSTSSGGATATGSLEFQRLDAGHFRLLMNVSASSPDGNNAKALAGFNRIDVKAKDRGLKGLKVTTTCTAQITKGGNIWADGSLKATAGETVTGDTVCAFNRFDPQMASGVVNIDDIGDEVDGTDRVYSIVYMNIGATATTHMFGDLDGGNASNIATVDVIVEPQY